MEEGREEEQAEVTSLSASASILTPASSSVAARSCAGGASGSRADDGGAGKEHMFDKILTPSDVGKRNRLVIPRKYAKKYLPVEPDKHLRLEYKDGTGQQGRFRYSYRKKSQSYVITKGWSRFVREKQLKAGDTISFYHGIGENSHDHLFIDWKHTASHQDDTPQHKAKGARPFDLNVFPSDTDIAERHTFHSLKEIPATFSPTDFAIGGREMEEGREEEQGEVTSLSASASILTSASSSVTARGSAGGAPASSADDGGAGKEHMFDMVLTPGDVGKLNRLVIPMQYAKKYLPAVSENGLLLELKDCTGQQWRFRYSYWNNSQCYAITEGWGHFIREKQLKAGDTISFYRGIGENSHDHLFISLSPSLSLSLSPGFVPLADTPQHKAKRARPFDLDVFPSDTDIAEQHKFHSLKEMPANLLSGSSASTSAAKYASVRLRRSLGIVGREAEEQRLRELILSGNQSVDRITVICIAAAGGMGKTTLVSLVYRDGMVRGAFDVKGWVSLSEVSDYIGLLRSILASLTGVSCGLFERDELEEIMKEELAGKRFLLVLDNVRMEHTNSWGDLLPVLSVGDRDSVVMVTTCSEMVARILSANRSYRLEPLEEQHCWRLLEESKLFGDVFPPKFKLDPSALTIRNLLGCSGIPILAKAIGGISHSEIYQEGLGGALISELSEMGKRGDSILPLLRLTYECLHPNGKQCFMYCSLFPKDYTFDKERLCRL